MREGGEIVARRMCLRSARDPLWVGAQGSGPTGEGQRGGCGCRQWVDMGAGVRGHLGLARSNFLENEEAQ